MIITGCSAATASFNSLQTGNCIQTLFPMDSAFPPIKFQFPSNGKLHSNIVQERSELTRKPWFQFPSNGKLHSNRQFFSNKSKSFKVSIPFKRETAFKLFDERRAAASRPVFQFPSNGETAFKPLRASLGDEDGLLFQFPSNGKLHSN